MTHRTLLLDLGNSRVKCRWLGDPTALSLPTPTLQAAAEFIRQLPGPPPTPSDRLVVSTSAGHERLQELAVLWPGDAWAVSSAVDLPSLRVQHQPIETLGTDRWLSWLGLINEKVVNPSALLIVNAGTATVCDLLLVTATGLQHHCGMILPGLRLMAESLSRETAALAQYLQGGFDWKHLRRQESSPAAIFRGIAAAQVGPVAWLVAESPSRTMVVHVGGGDGPLWAEALVHSPLSTGLPAPILWEESLVLRGLEQLMGLPDAQACLRPLHD